MILAVGPIPPTTTATQPARAPGNSMEAAPQHGETLFWPLFFTVLVIVVLYFVLRRLWRERRGGPEDDSGWNWRGWNGPDDWPKLPRLPKGGGGVPPHIPDWVVDEFKPPPTLMRPKPPGPSTMT